jgi:hypothetical protein
VRLAATRRVCSVHAVKITPFLEAPQPLLRVLNVPCVCAQRALCVYTLLLLLLLLLPEVVKISCNG